MGQYYKYINIDKRIIVNADCGSKLCEHSWLGNNEVVVPIKQLVKTEWQGDRVIQLGDYAEERPASAASTALRKEHLKFIEKIKKEVGMTNDQRLYWGDEAEEGGKFKEYTLEELFDLYDLKLEHDSESTPIPLTKKVKNVLATSSVICITQSGKNMLTVLRYFRVMLKNINQKYIF